MFGVGFFELLIIAVLGLLVFGPEKLPEAIRTLAFGMAKAKRSWLSTRRELEQELGMDEIRREIHNAQVMSDLEKNQRQQQSSHDDRLENSLSTPESDDSDGKSEPGIEASNAKNTVPDADPPIEKG